jgi:hypothetical protein
LTDFAAFRRCLSVLDIAGIRKLWRDTAPHLYRPRDDDDVLEAMHMARARMTTIPEGARAYSERWLADRDRVRTTEVVGYATNTRDTGLRDALTGGVARTIAMALSGGIAPSDRKELHPLMMDTRAKVKSGRVSV